VQPKSIPAPDVIQRLIPGAERFGQSVLAAAIAIAAATGARRRELLGIRWSDVDFDARIVRIRRAIKHEDGPGWVIGASKSDAERLIALDAFSIKLLKAHRKAVVHTAREAMVALEPDGYAFTFDPSGANPMQIRGSERCGP
jgi:integrase